MPYSYTDGDVRELLSPSLVPSDCVEMVHILRKNGGHGAPMGSAFVRVRGKDKATRIIDALNGKVQLPGAPNSLNVSFAQAPLFIISSVMSVAAFLRSLFSSHLSYQWF